MIVGRKRRSYRWQLVICPKCGGRCRAASTREFVTYYKCVDKDCKSPLVVVWRLRK